MVTKAFQQRSFEEFLSTLQKTVSTKENAKTVSIEIEKIRKNPPWKHAESKLTEGKAFKKHPVKGKELTWQAKKEIIDKFTKDPKQSLVLCTRLFTPQEKKAMKRKLEINAMQFKKIEKKAAEAHAEQMRNKTKNFEKKSLDFLKKGKKFGKKFTSLHRF